MTPRPLNPRMAWFSGYRIPYETWCQWTATLPTPPTPYQVREAPYWDDTIRDEQYYLSCYIEWKDSLPLRQRRMMPRPRYEDDLNQDTVSVFLPVRWTEYTSEYQVERGTPDYDEKICQEIESDRAQFQNFLKFVESQGTPLDEDKAIFGWKKDIDPPDDWRAIRSPH